MRDFHSAHSPSTRLLVICFWSSCNKPQNISKIPICKSHSKYFNRVKFYVWIWNERTTCVCAVVGFMYLNQCKDWIVSSCNLISCLNFWSCLISSDLKSQWNEIPTWFHLLELQIFLYIIFSFLCEYHHITELSPWSDTV